ncbi:MAG: hypothetical protein DLM72_20040 [Candidatus Nitrosopolaris wilkensis]|nr:MAG: hypothetical protein DLM72_20040 [Candidatus Nitrosopolaris wilkensis]
MNYPKLGLLKKSKYTIILSLAAMMIMATGSAEGAITPIHAQRVTTYANTLTVYLTLSGINSTTGEVFAFVKAHGAIKNGLFNATKLEIAQNNTSGIGQIYFLFPNTTLNAGEPYSTCVVVLKDVKMICTTDFKTPFPRPQYVDLSLQ